MKRFLKWTLGLLLLLVAGVIGFWFFFPKQAQAASGELLLRYLAFRSDAGPVQRRFTVQKDIGVSMQDGVKLATDLYLPEGDGKHAAVVVRTPYTKGEGGLIGEFFARLGYAVVVQDTRGRHKSEGEFYPFRHEKADGRDLTQWVKQQPWSNGKIGGFGLSYLGFTQWAMAVGNPDLASISPTFITSNLYDGIYSGGAFGQRTFLHWSLTSYGRFGNMAGARGIAKGFGHFPLVDSDDVALRDVTFYNDWVTHPEPGLYWEEMSPAGRLCEITAPAFLVAGWYDFFRDAQIRDFQKLRACGGAGEQSKMLIGPWSHSFFNGHSKEYGIKPGVGEAIPFEYIRESTAWLDYSLRGARNGWDRRAPLRVWVLGENVWRDEQQWPPADAAPRAYYLRSGGHLDVVPPAGDPPAEFEYDPRNPAPSVGGNHGEPAVVGPADQRVLDERRDVLVYLGPPLAEPVLVMGMVKATIFASSSAPDTDFTAKLVDVQPDGRALIVTDGIVRARYRNGFGVPELLKPGEVTRFEIEVGNTAVLFQAGHRIRLEISSSNWPRYDANPNTGREIATEREPVKASQRVYQDARWTSALYLPVVERRQGNPRD
jgi:uncharacterized protein